MYILYIYRNSYIYPITNSLYEKEGHILIVVHISFIFKGLRMTITKARWS